MLETLHQWLEPKATWALFTLLFIGFIVFAQLFDARHKALGGENKILDSRGWYNPAEVKSLFDNIKPLDANYLGLIKTKGLRLYAITELTLDLVFPFIYSLLIIIPIIHLYSAEKARYLILLPIIAAAADLCENFSIAYMAFTYDGNPPSIAPLAAVFTLLKTALLLICLVVLLVGAVISLRS